ncbi:MAG: hypothetical protein GY711_33240 [bacterium]|nr:hypothetical protein [bacterium]
MVQTIGGFTRWGAAITADDRWATRFGQTIEIYDSSATLVQTFDAPQVGGAFGDCGVFADGTIAVNSYTTGNVDIYDEAGVHQMTIDVPGGGFLFGLHIDPSDTMWICGTNTRHIWRYRQDGRVGPIRR